MTAGGVAGKVATTCPYCGVGCGLVIEHDEAGNVQLRGDSTHPANFGRLCSKGSALAETIDDGGRLLYPSIAGRRVDWDEALDAVAHGFRSIVAEHGPEAVAFYVSGQLLTEDYYVANKLMKGFIGSGNIDTNSRLCMSSAVAAHKRAFGADTVPGCYEDLELADFIVLVGSNLAWCHPVLYQRIVQAKRTRPALRVVVIDPRRTASCDIADTHLAIKPGTDSVLFNGLLNFLRANDALDWKFLEQHTSGFADASEAARESAGSIPAVAAACDLPEAEVAAFYNLFARTERTVTMFSQGVNQSSAGVDKANAIINCHLATGRIGKPGMGPFSVTGQPNAMGGREVGGLANQLAAHMDFAEPASVAAVAQFWSAPNMASQPGLKAVDLFEAVAAGKVKAVWVIATNPVVSLPDAEHVRKALKACELVVVSDCIQDTDTTRCADILLPATAWGEKEGTVTNSERRISRQRAFLTPPGEARHDWWIVSEVARRMGFAEAFDYSGPADIFREHARLSGIDNGAVRDFDISALADLDAADYDRLQPFQWPQPAGTQSDSTRLFGDGQFYTADRKARFIAVTPRPPQYAPDADYPLVLNTGRMRDHWHTMTRTGKSARLSAHAIEPAIQVHPDDAAQYGLEDGELAELRSRWGHLQGRVSVLDSQRRGEVFVPMHWNDIFASLGRVDAVVNPATDPISGQPESKHTPVSIRPYRPDWQGFILSRHRLSMSHAKYWSCAKGQELWRYEIAGDTAPDDYSEHARDLLAAGDSEGGDDGEWLEYLDRGQRRYRSALIRGGRLEGCLFIGSDHRLPPRDWLAQLFEQPQIDDAARAALLSGRPAAGQNDAGRTVCACFSVGINTLCAAIREQGLDTPEAIGKVLKAGTNCGSCVPELRTLIQSVLGKSAA